MSIICPLVLLADYSFSLSEQAIFLLGTSGNLGIYLSPHLHYS